MTFMDSIVLKNECEIIRIRPEELLFCEVDGNALTINFLDNRMFICTMTLKEAEKWLSGNFVRVNRKCLINVTQVKSYHRRMRLLTLTDGSVHQVSVRRARELVQKLEEDAWTLSEK